MLDADRTAMQRVGDFGTMASEIAGVVAPAAVAGRAGLPAAQALQESILGFSASPQAVAARNFAADEAGAVGPGRSGIRAFQGSPHNFAAERLVQMPDGSTEYIVGAPDFLPDVPAGATVLQDFPLGRMRTDKINTGEGAQAFGYGLYVAEAEDVAQGYRDALSRGIDDSGMAVRIDGQPIAEPTVEQVRAARFGVEKTIEGLEARLPSLQRAVEVASPVDELGLGFSDLDLAQMDLDAHIQKIEDVRSLAGRVEMGPAGSMYEVNINANPEDFLDWDAPLTEQPNIARRLGYRTRSVQDIDAEAEALFQKHGFYEDMPDVAKKRLEELSDEINMPPATITGEQAYSGGDELSHLQRTVTGKKFGPEDTAAMREAGIPGIRYRDASSRGMDGDGTRNYVVFDENLINIVKKYGIAGAAAILGVSAMDVEQAMAQGTPQPQGLLGGTQ
jgi:hypothetical protein